MHRAPSWHKREKRSTGNYGKISGGKSSHSTWYRAVYSYSSVDPLVKLQLEANNQNCCGDISGCRIIQVYLASRVRWAWYERIFLLTTNLQDEWCRAKIQDIPQSLHVSLWVNLRSQAAFSSLLCHLCATYRSIHENRIIRCQCNSSEHYVLYHQMNMFGWSGNAAKEMLDRWLWLAYGVSNWWKTYSLAIVHWDPYSYIHLATAIEDYDNYHKPISESQE